MDQLCVGPEGGRYLVRPGHVYRCHLDAVIRQYSPRKFVGAGIADIADDQMIAGLKERQECGADRSDAGRCGHRIVGALERGHPLFQLTHSGIGPARI